VSPTNLADLPSASPPNTGVGSVRRGSTAAGITWNNTVSERPMEDGGGSPMRLSRTPTRPGWWLIRAQSIWVVQEAVWVYWHWGVRLVPLDADGRGDDRNHMASHNALQWNESVINTAYRLNAGVPYYVEMYWPSSSSGYNQQYWCAADFLTLTAEFYEDGSL
jgi:hypothetical protein